VQVEQVLHPQLQAAQSLAAAAAVEQAVEQAQLVQAALAAVALVE
jgi:hypothetical protein